MMDTSFDTRNESPRVLPDDVEFIEKAGNPIWSPGPIIEEALKAHTKGNQDISIGLKVSAQIFQDRCTIVVSDGSMQHKNHFSAMGQLPDISSDPASLRGGAFFSINWETGTVEIFDESDTIGPIPESILTLVQEELERRVAEYSEG